MKNAADWRNWTYTVQATTKIGRTFPLQPLEISVSDYLPVREYRYRYPAKGRGEFTRGDNLSRRIRVSTEINGRNYQK
jgi:hypothetical protein